MSYSDFSATYEQQSLSFQDNHRQIADAIPAAIIVMNTLRSTELIIVSFGSRMNQFLAIQDKHEIYRCIYGRNVKKWYQ